MVRIVSDSSTLYSSAQARQAGFAISPLSVTIGGKSYREFDEISSDAFVDLIYQGHMPTSSQPAIGEVTALYEEFAAEMDFLDEYISAEGMKSRRVTLVTGKAAAPMLKVLCEMLCARVPELSCEVVAIENNFFGPEITVSGLVTGKDLTEQLAGKDLGEALLIPSVMLRHEQDMFLDDMTVEEVQNRLGVELRAVSNDGFLLADAMAGEPLL